MRSSWSRSPLFSLATGTLLILPGCGGGIVGPGSPEAAVKNFYEKLRDVDFEGACAVISPYQIQEMNTFSGCEPYVSTLEPPAGEIVVDEALITYEDGRAIIPYQAVTIGGETRFTAFSAIEIDGIWYIELE